MQVDHLQLHKIYLLQFIKYNVIMHFMKSQITHGEYMSLNEAIITLIEEVEEIKNFKDEMKKRGHIQTDVENILMYKLENALMCFKGINAFSQLLINEVVRLREQLQKTL